MRYRIQFHRSQYQFEECDVQYEEDAVNLSCQKRNQYESIQVYKDSDDFFNCVLMIKNGEVQWGEHSLEMQSKIQIREQDEYWDISNSYGFQPVKYDQINQYYDDNYDRIMESIWPVMPEWEEVHDILIRENNPDLFSLTEDLTPQNDEMTMP